MRRIQLVELEDQPWFPRAWRDAGTAYLELAARLAGHSALLAPALERVLRACGAKRIVDLCSGGGGPVVAITEELARRGDRVEVLLTDFYPNLPAFERARERSGGRIDFSTAPVDATRVPAELTGLRTIWNAFHHFRPESAARILADAADARQPIAVFEIVGREPASILGILFAPILFALALPFLRPFNWTWLPFTYLVPVLPLFVLWDGLVSCLRVYMPADLRALLERLEPRHRDAYAWEIAQVRLGAAPTHATVLVGLPRQSEA